jgi:hypothetical protein
MLRLTTLEAETINNDGPKQQSTPNSPIVAIPRAKAPFKELREMKKGQEAATLQKFILFNTILSTRRCCWSRFNRRDIACNCLSVMENRPGYCQAVREFQMMYGNFSATEQKI